MTSAIFDRFENKQSNYYLQDLIGWMLTSSVKSWNFSEF